MPEKTEKKKFEGMALECDVLRKMAHQLGRLPTTAAKLRAAEFVAKAAAEGKVEIAETLRPNGQPDLFGLGEK